MIISDLNVLSTHYLLIKVNSYANASIKTLILFRITVTLQKTNCLFNRNDSLQHTNQHINQLLQQCKDGEQGAQLEVYKRYYRAMYNTALRILKNSFDAEDMMQESFLIAFTKLSTFKGKVAFGAWLKRIVINKCLTQLKKNKRFEEVKLEVARDVNTEEEESIDYPNIDTSTVLTKINDLKSNYRIALTLHLIEGYDYEEVSEIMKISYQNSRTTISRAKNKLRELLHIQKA